jgi:hypothetical protein
VTPLYVKIAEWLFGILAAFASLIALAEVYPWVSIQGDTILDPTNPYSQMFSISNEGYIPLTDIIAQCKPDFSTTTRLRIRHSNIASSYLADYLRHGGRVTLPCFRIPAMLGGAGFGDISGESRMNIDISYDLYYVSAKFLRRHQTFNFKSVIAKDKTQHWEFLP